MGLAGVFQAGPRAAGFDSERWTTGRFAHAIRERFGVQYDPDHVGRILQRLGLRTRQRTRRHEGVFTMPNPIEVRPEATSSVA
jgi:hypothetical protein